MLCADWGIVVVSVGIASDLSNPCGTGALRWAGGHLIGRLCLLHAKQQQMGCQSQLVLWSLTPVMGRISDGSSTG